LWQGIGLRRLPHAFTIRASFHGGTPNVTVARTGNEGGPSTVDYDVVGGNAGAGSDQPDAPGKRPTISEG
jgi:hypothetical protein